MNPVYLHDWSEDGIEGIKGDFQIGLPEIEGVEVLLASYSYENYSGDAFVLFRKDGKYYEVNGSHCSCYGLEGQWEPEECSLVELKNRVTEGDFGKNDWCGNEFRDELFAILIALEGGAE